MAVRNPSDVELRAANRGGVPSHWCPSQYARSTVGGVIGSIWHTSLKAPPVGSVNGSPRSGAHVVALSRTRTPRGSSSPRTNANAAVTAYDAANCATTCGLPSYRTERCPRLSSLVAALDPSNTLTYPPAGSPLWIHSVRYTPVTSSNHTTRRNGSLTPSHAPGRNGSSTPRMEVPGASSSHNAGLASVSPCVATSTARTSPSTPKSCTAAGYRVT